MDKGSAITETVETRNARAKYFIDVFPPEHCEPSRYCGPASGFYESNGVRKYHGGYALIYPKSSAPRFAMREAWKAIGRLKRLGIRAKVVLSNEVTVADNASFNQKTA